MSRKEKDQEVRKFKRYLARSVTQHDYRHLEINREYDTLQKYKTHLRKYGAWGESEDILFMSGVLNINIFVFMLNIDTEYIPAVINLTVFDRNRQTILIYNFNNNHYETIVCLPKKQVLPIFLRFSCY